MTDPRQAVLCQIPTMRIPVDGAVVVARPTADTDHGQISDLHLRCTDTTRFYRYHCGFREPTSSMLEHLTDRGQGIYLAVHEPEGQLVGLCGLAFTQQPCTAEMGLMVVDSWQGRGIGRALFALLMRSAHAAGYERVRADMVAENRQVVAAAARRRPKTTDRTDPGVVSVVFAVAGWNSGAEVL